MEYLIRRITGRFKELDTSTLQMMRLELKGLISSWGGVFPGSFESADDERMPLWAEVEFLDNIVQFEVENNPFLVCEELN